MSQRQVRFFLVPIAKTINFKTELYIIVSFRAWAKIILVFKVLWVEVRQGRLPRELQRKHILVLSQQTK